MINLIIGAPRSGTTFLWTLLENNEDVVPLTLDTFNIKGKPKKYTTSESGAFYRKQYSVVDKFIINNKSKILIEKTPLNTLVYNEIPKKYIKNTILLYRNPVDIIASMFLSDTPLVFKKYDLNQSINETKLYYRKMQEIKNKANVIVKYEDLVKDIKNLKPVLDLLDIKNYNFEFEEKISIARRKNKKTLTDNQFEYTKSRVKDEIKIWKNL